MRIIIIIFLSLSFTGFSQTMLDIENQWVYKRISMNSKSFVKYYFGADTLINGNNYRTLKSVGITYLLIGEGNWVRQEDEELPDNFLREWNGEIVYWNETNQTDKVLYPTTISVGQNWEVSETSFFPCGDDFASQDIIQVNEEVLENYSNEEILTFLVSSNGDWSFGDKIYNNIGGNSGFFAFPGENCEFIDNNVNYTESLACFSRGLNHIIFNPEESEFCQDVLATYDLGPIAQSLDIKILPNPAKNRIYIKSSNILKPSVEIFDDMGKLVDKVTLNNMELDILNLPIGHYFVRFETENGMKKSIKLIKK